MTVPLLAVAALLATLIAHPCRAFEGKPKLGPEAIPLSEATEYLRRAPALDYWELAQFYVSQPTASACSVAAVSMAINFIRGLPPGAEDELVTPQGLLDALADPTLHAKNAEDGDGVLFAELHGTVDKALEAYRLEATEIEVFRPLDDSPRTLARLRAILAANEANGRDVLLAYFNQGVLTGDWDGPHVSPIGAYDARAGRVLVMDVDRKYYVPFWSADTKLLEAMLRPAPSEHGPLAGETGGLVWLKGK